MIYKLHGILDEVDDFMAIVNVAGVGYGVQMPTGALTPFAPGSAVELFIETVVREDSITLYGFASKKEKDLFNLLTTVQGVGPKVALSLLSFFKPAEISAAIITGDHASLSRANGVGGKTAARITSELKDKIVKLGMDAGLAEIDAAVSGNSTATDAISALINLGYPRADAAVAVGEVLKSKPSAGLNEIIKLSLSQLASLP